MAGPKLLSAKWNLKTQTPHGGQEWRDIKNFVEDFSVTTNPLGSPAEALKCAAESLSSILHYPPSDFDPAWSSLAQFIAGPAPLEGMSLTPEAEDLKERLILGNGASELIDLVIRLSPGTTWRPGPALSQYKEYQRSSMNHGRTTCAWDDKTAQLLCIVNPCNPTGDFKNAADMQAFIEEYCPAPGTTVVVDESMQPWLGPNWRDESLTSKNEWIEMMSLVKNVKVFIIHSWTKLWSCPGLRLGSIIAPTPVDAERLRKVQVPWSVNTPGIAFLDAVVRDTEYLEKTWALTSQWRAAMVEGIHKLHPEWEFHGASFLSFIWIDTKSEQAAEKYVTLCREMGVPVRWGSYGYDKPTFIRLGVRDPRCVEVLLQAMSQ